MPATEEVRECLRAVADPCAIATGVAIDLVAMGLVEDIQIDNGDVVVVLRLTSPFCMQIGLMAEKIKSEVSSLAWVRSVEVVVDHTAEWMPEMMDVQSREKLRLVRTFPAATA